MFNLRQRKQIKQIRFEVNGTALFFWQILTRNILSKRLPALKHIEIAVFDTANPAHGFTFEEFETRIRQIYAWMLADGAITLAVKDIDHPMPEEYYSEQYVHLRPSQKAFDWDIGR